MRVKLNTAEYISSGILESYVLGLCDTGEKAEVEACCVQYPDVKTALGQIEIQFEMAALEAAIPPPADTWNKVEARIRELDIVRHTGNPHQNRYTFTNGNGPKTAEKEPHTIINVQASPDQITVHKYWRPAFIAVFILGKIFLAGAIYYYLRVNNLQEQNLELKTQVQQLQQK